VTSYGIIAVRYTDNSYLDSMFVSSNIIPIHHDSIQFLLIQRKDSLSFIEFIRGKYNHHNIPYLSKILRGMTVSEHKYLLTKTFDELWYHIWGDKSCIISHRNDYETSKSRYTQIADRIPQLIRDNPTIWMEPEWGFPKGRRNPHESDIHCAIREFQEETGLERDDFSVIQNTHSITETFFGSNHVHYCHKYYIAVCNKSVEVRMNMNNPHMTSEIGEIKWCTLEEAISKIRPDNIEKREVLLKAEKIMKTFHPIPIY
jgi:8-oxo-dGTP pyrophosphatase MutT (NUDIX family)